MATVDISAKALRIARKSAIRTNDLDDLFNILIELVVIVTEFKADHAISVTLQDELVADHATFKTVVDDLKTMANLLQAQVGDALQVKGTILISGTAEEFKTTTIARVLIGGVSTTKATTDNLTFTAAHAVSLDKFGTILIQINTGGTISTKVAKTPQDYATAALALDVLPAPDADNVALGYITIQADGTEWLANTDDMTDASDLDAATFVDAGVVVVPSRLAPTAVSSSSPGTLGAVAQGTLTAETPDTPNLVN